MLPIQSIINPIYRKLIEIYAYKKNVVHRGKKFEKEIVIESNIPSVE